MFLFKKKKKLEKKPSPPKQEKFLEQIPIKTRNISSIPELPALLETNPKKVLTKVDTKKNDDHSPLLKERQSIQKNLEVIEQNIKDHYKEISLKMAEDFDILEKIVISELRKTKLQIKMSIQNELEVQLLNIKDIKLGFLMISNHNEHGRIPSFDLNAASKRIKLTHEDKDHWDKFYKFYCENSKEILNLISSSYDVLHYSDFSQEFEQSFKSSLLNSFKKPRFFLSEVINNFNLEKKKAAVEDSSSSSMNFDKETKSSPYFLGVDFLSGTDISEMNQFRTVSFFETTSMTECKGRAPLILSFSDDILFYSLHDEFVQAVELSTRQGAWSSPDLGGCVKDMCFWQTGDGPTSLAICLDNDFIVSSFVTVNHEAHEADTMLSIDPKPALQVSLDYNYPQTIVGITGISKTPKVIVMASNGNFCVCDIFAKTILTKFTREIIRVTCFTLADDNKMIAIGSGSLNSSNENSITIYSIRNVINESFTFHPYHVFPKCYEMPRGVFCLVSPNQPEMPFVFSGGADPLSGIKIWNIKKKELMMALKTEGPVYQLAILSTVDPLSARCRFNLGLSSIIGYGDKNLFVFTPETEEKSPDFVIVKNGEDGVEVKEEIELEKLVMWRISNQKHMRVRGSLKKSLQLTEFNKKIHVIASNLLEEIEMYTLEKQLE